MKKFARIVCWVMAVAAVPLSLSAKTGVTAINLQLFPATTSGGETIKGSATLVRDPSVDRIPVRVRLGSESPALVAFSKDVLEFAAGQDSAVFEMLTKPVLVPTAITLRAQLENDSVGGRTDLQLVPRSSTGSP